MKNIVIIIGTVVLGCLIFNMIAGEKNSLKSAATKAMERQIKTYQQER